MEQSTSKVGINILIILAIVLIGASLTTVYLKKTTVNEITKITIPEPVEKTVIVSTTTTNETIVSSTTEVIATSTSTTSTSTKSFTDKTWAWTKTTATDITTTPKKSTAFTLILNKDGTLKGTTDCNNFFGTYKTEAQTITFGPLGSTKMFCEDSQERDFINSLQDVTSYVLDKSNTLILNNSSSSMTFK